MARCRRVVINIIIIMGVTVAVAVAAVAVVTRYVAEVCSAASLSPLVWLLLLFMVLLLLLGMDLTPVGFLRTRGSCGL